MKILLMLGWAFAFAGGTQAAEDGRFHPIPLDEAGGKPLANYAANAPWFQAPQGNQTFLGVPFEPLMKVQVHGNVDFREGRVYPTRVMSITVGKSGGRLHVIHGSTGNEQDGRPVALMKVRYAGGRSYNYLFTYGVNTRDWWKHPNESKSTLSDTNSAVIWTGTSADSRKSGSTHRLFKTTVQLPPSEQTIEAVDLLSLFSNSSFEILALTLEAGKSEAAALPSADDSKFRDEVTLEVINQAGERLPGAVVRGSVADGMGNSGISWRSNEAISEPGLVPVDYPAGSSALRLVVSATDYAPGNLELKPDASGHFPRQMQVQLEQGARISGLVLSADGSPVNKAKVEILGQTKGPTGRSTSFIYEEKTTDARGRWRMQAAPPRLENLSFKVTHKDFRAATFEVTPGSSSNGKNSIAGDALLAGKAEFKLSPGILITGIVTDPDGKKIEGAKVSFLAEKGTRTRAPLETDSEGRFTLAIKQGGAGHLVVDHPDYTPAAPALTVAENMEPLKLSMARGVMFTGKVLGRPLNATNQLPLVSANVTISSRENSLVRWSGTTDSAGRFSWQNAPTGALYVMPQQKGFISQMFYAEPGKGSNEFVMSVALSLRGTVVDAKTRKPIPAFTVTPGDNYNEEQYNWRQERKILGTNGNFILEDTTGGYRMQLLAKIEAPGYWPYLLRLETNGTQNMLFELSAGSPVKGIVKLPDGQPAASAEVTVIGDTYVTLGRGHIKNRNYGMKDLAPVRTDAQGQFELPPGFAQRVFIVNDAGCAETTLSNLMQQPVVTLQRFGTIEGILMVGNKPGANLEIKLNDRRNGGFGFDYDYADFDMHTDAEG
ncbi:MAG TPA: carboxypeptidase regulatory-like domain-containing protein, partial [Candidatus Saccharimonadales bacterium]|nr:carboxypeptidase regulatory-like domain-containing protein [Candidatus Saccharimonadales bacterium]